MISFLASGHERDINQKIGVLGNVRRFSMS